MTRLLSSILLLTLFSFIFIGCSSQENENKNKVEEELQEKSENQTSDKIDGEITDAEVTAFVTIYQKMYGLQQKFQMQAMQVVQQSDLSFEKYRAIAGSKQNPNQPNNEAFTDAEMTSFNNIENQLQNLETRILSESESFFIDENLSQERYNQIGETSQVDTVLQMRLRNESDRLRQQQMENMQQMKQNNNQN
jgi:hypothetical protein